MPYDRNPPAPLRFLEDEPEPRRAVTVTFRWPTVGDLVLQMTAPAENFVEWPRSESAAEAQQ